MRQQSVFWKLSEKLGCCVYIIVFPFLPKGEAIIQGFIPSWSGLCQELSIWKENVSYIPIGSMWLVFLLHRIQRPQVFFGFFTNWIILYNVVESLWGKQRAQGFLFYHLSALTILNLFFITMWSKNYYFVWFTYEVQEN